MRFPLWIAVCAVLATTPARSAESVSDIAVLRQLLAQPEGRIDLAQAKVAIDRMIDPSIDAAATLSELDDWTQRVRARLPIDATPRATLDVLLSTLYEPGPWNERRPFAYDFDKPIASSAHDTLLPRYLARRKGQCVVMPIAVVLIGQKLGLPVTLAKAPNHLLVKYGDQVSGQWLNVEATSGTLKYDSSYQRELDIPEEAFRHGTYLRPLSQRESVMLMAHSLMQIYAQKREPEKMMALADLALEVDPQDVLAAAGKGAAYYLLLEQRIKRKYAHPGLIPPAKYGEYWLLSHQNLLWYAAAEALGWREWTAEKRAEYARNIRLEKIKREGN